MKYFKTIFLLFLFNQNAMAVTITNLQIEPALYALEPDLTGFPIEITKNYSLKIDSQNSFFQVRKSLLSFDEINDGLNKYMISGDIALYKYYFEDAEIIIRETKVTAINFESELNNLAFSKSFWAEDYALESAFVLKSWNLICACISTSNPFAPFVDGSFDNQKLILNGGGYFIQDASDGMFRLSDLDWDATHQISYRIEATVLSAVPIPAAFYLMASGLMGMLIYRLKLIDKSH